MQTVSSERPVQCHAAPRTVKVANQGYAARATQHFCWSTMRAESWFV